ncbi:MAG: hypothetical protein AB7O93_06810 [Vicinamibacterales bacterium]
MREPRDEAPPVGTVLPAWGTLRWLLVGGLELLALGVLVPAAILLVCAPFALAARLVLVMVGLL